MIVIKDDTVPNLMGSLGKSARNFVLQEAEKVGGKSYRKKMSRYMKKMKVKIKVCS